MARQTRNYTKRRSNGKNSLAFVWLTLGIFLGIGAMALAYVFFTSHQPIPVKTETIVKNDSTHQTIQNQNNINIKKDENPIKLKSTYGIKEKSTQVVKEKSKQVKNQQNKSKENAQRFEFYTLLPGMEVELPDQNQASNTNSNNNANSKIKIVQNNNSNTTNKANEKPKQLLHYIIQAGIFQELNKADTLKAKLTLLGFSPVIQKVQTQEGHAWFRVTLGPFGSESLALNQKKQLEEQKIRGILILQRSNQ